MFLLAFLTLAFKRQTWDYRLIEEYWKRSKI
jgi:hypothetical protein